MELTPFVREVEARGGECPIWLVYLADRFAEPEGRHPALVLQQAFFTRGEAYAFAEGSRVARMWRHFYVFRVDVDVAWAATDSARTAEFETAFGRARDLPDVRVTPTDVARAFGET